MDEHLYNAISAQEDRHWWFVARRAVISAFIRHLKLSAGAKILEAGCGSGGSLPMLANHGDVYAFEIHTPAREQAKARNIGRIEAGELPDALPFPGVQFDLILLLDVLEHIENDAAALKSLAGRLAPGGRLLITVPAFQWLFSRHDAFNYHHRRYGKAELVQKLEAAGFGVRTINYWNVLLFPIAALLRLLERFNAPSNDLTRGVIPPPAPINSLLAKIISWEGLVLPHVPMPFGLSVIAVAEKR